MFDIFDVIIPVFIFILILGVVIFAHELGHYLMAIRAGIFVEEFALGMGPKILQFKGKKRSTGIREGEEVGDLTLYTLRLLPIGGFCKMRGEDSEIHDDPEAFNNKPIWSRIMVIAGGSFMNFVLAFVLFFLLVILRGYPVAEVNTIDPVMPGYASGLQVGDRITHVNGNRVGVYDDFLFMLDMSFGNELDIRVNRGGESVDLQVTPIWVENRIVTIYENGEYIEREQEIQRYLIGFTPGRRFGLLHDRPDDPNANFERVGIISGVAASSEMINFHVRAPFRLLARLIAGDPMPEDVGVMGPIGIAGIVTEVYQEVAQFGFLNTLLTMLMFTALINTALGIMNLLPIPALDGARLIFLFIEGLRKKPVPPEKEATVHLVGIVCLLLLAAFVAYRDIMRLL